MLTSCSHEDNHSQLRMHFQEGEFNPEVGLSEEEVLQNQIVGHIARLDALQEEKDQLEREHEDLSGQLDTQKITEAEDQEWRDALASLHEIDLPFTTG